MCICRIRKRKKVVKNLGTETDSIKSMKTNKHTHTQTKRENSTPKKVLFGWWLLFLFFSVKNIKKREKQNQRIRPNNFCFCLLYNLKQKFSLLFYAEWGEFWGRGSSNEKTAEFFLFHAPESLRLNETWSFSLAWCCCCCCNCF